MIDIGGWMMDIFGPYGAWGILLVLFLIFYIDAVFFPTLPEIFFIIGIMYDRDFMGCTTVESFADTTPFNIKGRYWNDQYSDLVKTRHDMTEKAVLILLD